MTRRLHLLLAVLLLGLLGTLPARAATVIDYSAAENTYGWCGGYGLARARSCAAEQCQKYGGTDCRHVLICDGGWGSVAFAREPGSGFGATCDISNPASARMAALAACVVASNALCRTSTTFDGRGNTRPEAENERFDLVWYTQLLLQVSQRLDDVADGAMGPNTRAAISTYETDLGLPVTGEPSEALVQSLVYAATGVTGIARTMQRDILEKTMLSVADVIYGDSGNPSGAKTFSEELGAMSEADRRAALATYLTSRDTRCSVPAMSADPIPDVSAGIWSVGCAESDFMVMFSDTGSVVINNGKGAAEPDAPLNPEPQVAPAQGSMRGRDGAKGR